MKVIQVKDPSSGDPQEVPGVGIFPMRLNESEFTESEWRSRIKKEGLPLEIKETKDAPDAVVPDPAAASEGGE